MANDDWGRYRVRAHNIAADSENKIHDDRGARQYGFAGGLVPGIVVYGYLTRPVVERLGTEWLARGTATARFLQPCYEDEEISVAAERDPSASILTLSLTAQRPDGTVCARGTATLPAGPATAPPLASDGVAGGQFGFGVALQDDTLLVGAPGQHPPVEGYLGGEAYVDRLDGR